MNCKFSFLNLVSLSSPAQNVSRILKLFWTVSCFLKSRFLKKVIYVFFLHSHSQTFLLIFLSRQLRNGYLCFCCFSPRLLQLPLCLYFLLFQIALKLSDKNLYVFNKFFIYIFCFYNIKLCVILFILRKTIRCY